jgi:hypothetical protein
MTPTDQPGLAITATVTHGGLRFRYTAGAHPAVDDYALATSLVNRSEWRSSTRSEPCGPTKSMAKLPAAKTPAGAGH